jgi:NAD dependent epimerase/dehydratase family enzyme
VLRTRTVRLRTAVVMSPESGSPFDILLRLVRFGLGGRSGDGRQYVSWIHDADFVRATDWIVRHDALTGPVNLAAPEPLPNEAFMRALRRAWGISIGLPSPGWMLEIGARALGTESELVLKSRFVVPGKLAASGFTFDFPGWNAAADDLCARWRRDRGAPLLAAT